MNSIKYAENLVLVRSIINELRLATKEYKKPAAENGKVEDYVKHMLNILRENQVTEKRFCRPIDHYKYYAQTYLSYLRSIRLQDEITQKYFNKGDRSIEDSARLVGLELPKQDSH